MVESLNYSRWGRLLHQFTRSPPVSTGPPELAMEPKFVFSAVRDKAVTAQLQRALQDLYHSPKGRSKRVEYDHPVPRLPLAGTKSSPGHLRLEVLLKEQSHCPTCKRIMLPRELRVYSQELRVKHCMCCRSLSPRATVNLLDISKKKLETDRRVRRPNAGEVLSSLKSSTEVLVMRPGLSRTKLEPIKQLSISRAESLHQQDATSVLSRSIDEEIKEQRWSVMCN